MSDPEKAPVKEAGEPIPSDQQKVPGEPEASSENSGQPEKKKREYKDFQHDEEKPTRE